jgi:hypothetical protein
MEATYSSTAFVGFHRTTSFYGPNDRILLVLCYRLYFHCEFHNLVSGYSEEGLAFRRMRGLERTSALVSLLSSTGLLSTYKQWSAEERPIKGTVQPERFKAMRGIPVAPWDRNDRPGPSIHRGRLARNSE